MKNTINGGNKSNRKQHSVIFFVLMIFTSFQGCVGQEICSVKGVWLIKKGRLFENYEGASPYSANRLTFYEDSVELASGFFYNTLGWNDEYPNGRYPFVYYGNKEKYKAEGKLLYIFSKPYNSWSSYRFDCLTSQTIQLIGQTDTLLLTRLDDIPENTNCNIEAIRAHVYKGTLDIFNVGYRVTFSHNDEMIYEEQDSATENFTRRTFRLRKGTFENICKSFQYVDLNTIKPIYPATESDYQKVEVEIQLASGKTVKTEIQDVSANNAPDELRLALIPVLYLHQAFVYPTLRAKRFKDK
jgi:hypothetical protein